MAYLDFDNDEISISDNDDLAVCIMEFTEASKIDQAITLVIQGGEALPEVQSENLIETCFKKKDDQSAITKSEHFATVPDQVLTESNADDFEPIDAISAVSEKVMSEVESKIADIEARMSDMLQKKLTKTLDDMKSEADKKKAEKKK